MLRNHKSKIAFLLIIAMILTATFTGSAVFAMESKEIALNTSANIEAKTEGSDPEGSDGTVSTDPQNDQNQEESGEEPKVTYDGPGIINANASTYYVTVGKVHIDASFAYGSYTENETKNYVYDIIVELYRNGIRIDKRIATGDSYSITTDVSYDKNDTFELKVFMEVGGKVYPGHTATMTMRSSQMGKNKVRATRIDSKKAVIRWNGSEGATGYRIIKGKKKLKDVKASVKKYVVKKKGAGKAKYKVLPLFKAEGKTHIGKSNTASPKANSAKYSKAKSWRDFQYLTSRYVVKEISLKGKTYKVKGFFYNSSHRTKLKKYKRLVIKIYADKKKVASKTYRNVKMNLKGETTKKHTYTFKGKAGADLRNGNSYVKISVKCDPDIFN